MTWRHRHEDGEFPSCHHNADFQSQYFSTLITLNIIGVKLEKIVLSKPPLFIFYEKLINAITNAILKERSEFHKNSLEDIEKDIPSEFIIEKHNKRRGFMKIEKWMKLGWVDEASYPLR